jgi:hypothetical protein
MARRITPNDHRARETRPEAGAPISPAGNPDPAAAEEAADVTDQMAELVAAGVLPFPGALSVADARTLAIRVHTLRRERLIQFVARALALSIHRGGP